MGRKEFIKDVENLKSYLENIKIAEQLVKSFNFRDPELTFSFQYSSKKYISIVIYVNAIDSYPRGFDGFICINDDSGDKNVTSAANSLGDLNMSTQSLSYTLSSILSILSKSFSIKLPNSLSSEALLQASKSLPKQPQIESISTALPDVILTNYNQLLEKNLRELRHYKYNVRLWNVDQFGTECSVAFPVNRLGLSNDALLAWNLEADRYVVCFMQFGNRYIDCQSDIEDIFKKTRHSKDFSKLKSEIRKKFPMQFKIFTTTNPDCKYSFGKIQRNTMYTANHSPSFTSTANVKIDESEDSDHFLLSWTLSDLLSSKFLDFLCDKIWFSLGWESAEFADQMRTYGSKASPYFLNDDSSVERGELDLCLEKESEFRQSVAARVLSIMEQEKLECSTEARNQNFLLSVVRYLRRRILLCTKYCLICHQQQSVNFATLKPFVCESPLCQHQAQAVGLGKLFEAEMIGNESVIDLLISLCWVAVEQRNLVPTPEKSVSAIGWFQMEVSGRIKIVSVGTGEGVVGRTVHGSVGFRIEGREGEFEMDSHRAKVSGEIFAQQFKEGDMLVLLHPDTNQELPRNPKSLETHIRVVGVGDGWVMVDNEVVLPYGLSLKHKLLEFRLFRWTEQNFFTKAGITDYERLRQCLNKLPSVSKMISYIESSTTSLRKELDILDPLCYPLLSWIISSNRTHLRALEEEYERVQIKTNDSVKNQMTREKYWKQFVMLMASPEKELIFQAEKEKLKKEAGLIGELYCWHGSPLTNWHSIIRTSLNFKKVVHGRAYGNGVYMAVDADTSYAYSGRSGGVFYWPQSKLEVSACLSLTEVINRPSQFVSTNPYLVVKNEDWITTRYLFVECRSIDDEEADNSNRTKRKSLPSLAHEHKAPKYINLDNSRRPTFLNRTRIEIPERSYLLLKDGFVPESTSVGLRAFVPGEDDKPIVNWIIDGERTAENSHHQPTYTYIHDEEVYQDDEVASEEEKNNDDVENDDSENDDDYPSEDEESEEMDIDFSENPTDTKEKNDNRDDEDDGDDDEGFDLTLLPLPNYGSNGATRALSKELTRIVQLQNKNPTDLGFTLDMKLLKSVYQWVIHMNGFDPLLPLSKDMKHYGVSSIDMEIRFSSDFPHSPPYIRIIKPRFLPFSRGGGGHVTIGGSICMDLLTFGSNTDSGWSAVYRMDAVLLQVKMALSSVDPRPAKLDPQMWSHEYSSYEAIEAFYRVAGQHGWRVPQNWRQMFA